MDSASSGLGFLSTSTVRARRVQGVCPSPASHRPSLLSAPLRPRRPGPPCPANTLQTPLPRRNLPLPARGKAGWRAPSGDGQRAAMTAQSTLCLRPPCCALAPSRARGCSSGTDALTEESRRGHSCWRGLGGTVCGTGFLACYDRGTRRWGQEAGCGPVSRVAGSRCENTPDKPKPPPPT